MQNFKFNFDILKSLKNWGMFVVPREFLNAFINLSEKKETLFETELVEHPTDHKSHNRSQSIYAYKLY